MIKVTPVELKVNALARALKLRFEEGEYVTERKQRATPGTRRSYRRRAASKKVAAPTTRRRYTRFPQSLFTTLRGLSVGETLDITSDVHGLGATFKSTVGRIGTFQWQERKNSGRRNVRYTTRRAHGRIIVERTA